MADKGAFVRIPDIPVVFHFPFDTLEAVAEQFRNLMQLGAVVPVLGDISGLVVNFGQIKDLYLANEGPEESDDETAVIRGVLNDEGRWDTIS